MPTLLALFKMLLKLNCIPIPIVLLSRGSSFPFVLLRGETQSAAQEQDCFIFSSMAEFGLDCTEALKFQAPRG